MVTNKDCPHSEPYMCPDCGLCLPCYHKRKWTPAKGSITAYYDEIIWWVCPGTKTMIRIGSDGKVFERKQK